MYDVLVKAKNGYGWSDWSVIFNLFKKGVGEYRVGVGFGTLFCKKVDVVSVRPIPCVLIYRLMSIKELTIYILFN